PERVDLLFGRLEPGAQRLELDVGLSALVARLVGLVELFRVVRASRLVRFVRLVCFVRSIRRRTHLPILSLTALGVRLGSPYRGRRGAARQVRARTRRAGTPVPAAHSRTVDVSTTLPDLATLPSCLLPVAVNIPP
ncbi:MAG TPA: hypothetical protein VMD28_03575, partial [Acidimicrobiales bacterium]|nr:hypothetical protein [Acidimicrobiales bacterium]